MGDDYMADLSRFGWVAVCSKGRVGIVTGWKHLPWGWSYVGVGTDGKPWASRSPRWVAECVKGGYDEATEEDAA